jgi:hypothetical protein
VVISASLFVAPLMAGCGTGPRPTLGEQVGVGGATGTATGIPAADAVLERLEGRHAGSFTAVYRVIRRVGPLETEAVVAQEDHEGTRTARAVTVGDVRAIVEPEPPQTCAVDGSDCEPGVNDARISDYAIPFSFSGESAARRLRVALTRRTAEPTGAEQTIAGVAAECVSVPLGEGAETYCATGAGPLARLDAADVSIELRSFTDTVDAALLGEGG